MLHGSHRPGELDGPPSRLWRVFIDGESKLLREGTHRFDCRRIGAVLLAVLGARKAIFAQRLVLRGLLRLTMTETVMTLAGRTGFSPVLREEALSRSRAIQRAAE